jgi:hypothetical protein
VRVVEKGGGGGGKGGDRVINIIWSLPHVIHQTMRFTLYWSRAVEVMGGLAHGCLRKKIFKPFLGFSIDRMCCIKPTLTSGTKDREPRQTFAY